MLFSIIVPVYNVRPFLRRCLASLIGQTCEEWEIIVIDDGSTDGSSEICDEFAGHEGVTVIHQKNAGLSAARNAGMAKATGDWLVFVDADDWVDPDMLEILQGHILASNADFYRLSMKVTDENGNLISAYPVAKSDTIISFPDEKNRFGFYFHLFMRTVRVWGGAYRRSIVEKYHLRFVDTELVYAEDLLFNFQYLLRASKIAYLKDAPYYYRKRPGSLTDITDFEKRLPRVETLGEMAYESLDEKFPLFKSNYFYIYFKLLNRFIMRDATEHDDAQVRRLLDELDKKTFHRDLMSQIRWRWASFRSYTGGRQWYREDFGTKSALKKQERFQKFLSLAKKSPLAWRLWFFYLNVRHARQGTHSFPAPYIRDDEHKVAYLSMAKVACSSISVSMLRRDDIPDDYSIFEIRKPFSTYEPITEGGWFRFTFVRNPFARLVSCYESKFHTDPLVNKNAIKRQYLDFDHYLYGYMKRDAGFPTFINQIVSIPWRLDNAHFGSQYRRMTDKNGKLLVDYIGKFEHLVEDYELVRARGNFAPLKIYNKSAHGDWRDYYTTDLVKKVYRKYKADVIFLGYEQEYKDLLEYCRQKGR